MESKKLRSATLFFPLQSLGRIGIGGPHHNGQRLVDPAGRGPQGD